MAEYTQSQSIPAQLTQLAIKNVVPLSVTLETTQKCNLACFHCYNFDRTQPNKFPSSELTSSEIMRLIEELAELGTLFLTFTGGEATIDKNLTSYVVKARKHFMRVSVKTNGVAQPGTFTSLAQSGVSEFDVSLYGMSTRTHDQITMRPGSFEKTLAGIDEITQSGAKLRINFLVAQSSVHEIPLMLKLADQYQSSYGMIFNFTKRYDGTSESTQLSINREILKQIYQGPLKQFQITTPDYSPDRNMDCACAKSNCGIGSNGDVYPCIGCPIPSGNIRKQSIRQIWKTSPQFQRIRNLKSHDFKTCQPCPDKGFCSRSSGNTYVNTGHYTGPEEWTCMAASVQRELYENTHPTSLKKKLDNS